MGTQSACGVFVGVLRRSEHRSQTFPQPIAQKWRRSLRTAGSGRTGHPSADDARRAGPRPNRLRDWSAEREPQTPAAGRSVIHSSASASRRDDNRSVPIPMVWIRVLPGDQNRAVAAAAGQRGVGSGASEAAPQRPPAAAPRRPARLTSSSARRPPRRRSRCGHGRPSRLPARDSRPSCR
ncbi:Uncharacterised protein [Mycobacteroides abscessus subsp. abscessus]|nr:Uncharacterised protein [Mycobacteroides abscessus subsp. abscessus]